MKSISTFTVVHLSSFITTLGHHSWQVCFNQQPEGNYFVVRHDNLIPQSQGHHRSGKLTCLFQCLHAVIVEALEYSHGVCIAQYPGPDSEHEQTENPKTCFFLSTYFPWFNSFNNLHLQELKRVLLLKVWLQNTWPLISEMTAHPLLLSAAAQPHLLPCPRLGTKLDLTAAYLNSSVQQKSIHLFAVGLVS